MYNQKYNALNNFELGDGDILYHKSRNGDPRRVVTNKEVFNTIKQTHIELDHAGGKRTYSAVNQRFYGINKKEVEYLLRECQICLRARPTRTRSPIVREYTLERVHIDLVDMRPEPDRQYKWILHVQDHFSKYSWLYPLESKQAEEVADAIALFIGAFGAPKILQCDSEREFKSILLVLLRAYGIKVINGRPRIPHTLVQANHTMKIKISAWKADMQLAGGDHSSWARSLPGVSLNMNCQPHGSLGGKVPYELMFNRAPQWVHSISYAERAGNDVSDEVIANEEPETRVTPVWEKDSSVQERRIAVEERQQQYAGRARETRSSLLHRTEIAPVAGSDASAGTSAGRKRAATSTTEAPQKRTRARQSATHDSESLNSVKS
jgi:hypothetical protein